METSETSSPATEAAETTAAVVTDNGEATEQTMSYANGKYETVSALETGYAELQSAFSKKTAEYSSAMAGQTGAPEAYEFGEGTEVSEGMQAYAKENNFSNEALNNLANAYQADNQARMEAHVAEQKELLGKDADTRLTNLQDWAKANGGDDAVFNGMITSAAAVEFMENVMKMSRGTAQAAAPSVQPVDAESVQAMRMAKDQYGNRRMSSDPAYRAKVTAATEQLLASR